MPFHTTTTAPILTPSQKDQFERDGYLLLPSFFDKDETSEMLLEAKRLCDDFDITGHPMTTFKTAADGEHVGDDYFLESGDKIRYFLEPSALSQATSDPPKLLVDPAHAINKIGHGLILHNEIFRKYTLSSRMSGVARCLGAQRDPRVLQSMIICKQPRIGGVVPCHNDSTFLYTDPPSAIGAWIALEECTSQNGCLSFLPGSHKVARVSSRFVRDSTSKAGTTFVPVPGVEANQEKWDELDGWEQAPCPPGTLVLIHGSVMHKSPPNHSDKSRLIYTFHMIEGSDGYTYDEKNWLQPTKEAPFPSLF